jgi:hypothetical protein
VLNGDAGCPWSKASVSALISTAAREGVRLPSGGLQLETGTAWQASPSAGPRSKAEHVDAVAYKLRRGLKLSQTSAIAFQAVPPAFLPAAMATGTSFLSSTRLLLLFITTF